MKAVSSSSSSPKIWLLAFALAVVMASRNALAPFSLAEARRLGGSVVEEMGEVKLGKKKDEEAEDAEAQPAPPLTEQQEEELLVEEGVIVDEAAAKPSTDSPTSAATTWEPTYNPTYSPTVEDGTHAPTELVCRNDVDYRYNGIDWKDCVWVGQNQTKVESRCRKGEGAESVYANCPLTCNAECQTPERQRDHVQQWLDPRTQDYHFETDLTDAENKLVRQILVDAIHKQHHDNELKISQALPDAPPPLEIFLMVGQSNTEGHGWLAANAEVREGNYTGTLEWLMDTQPETYGRLKTVDDEWTERDDVYISTNRQKYSVNAPHNHRHGRLRAGYGGDNYGLKNTEIGPELGFGWTVGDAYKEKLGELPAEVPRLFLAKIAWGGRSMAVNFRPPSSGGALGPFYVGLLANLNATLGNLTQFVPGYTPDRGYRIRGMTFHQGWNDGCVDDQASEYEFNLANFLRDFPADIGVPDLPVAIGVSGQLGYFQPLDSPTPELGELTNFSSARTRKSVDRRYAILDGQFAVANASVYPELAARVASVETRHFYRAEDVSPGKQIYHWNNNCESYWLVGVAMAEALLGLIRDAI